MSCLRRRLVFCVLLSMFHMLSSCQRHNLKDEVYQIIGSKVVLYIDSLCLVSDWCDVSVLDFTLGHHNLIVYYDSLSCSACTLGKMEIWREMIDRAKKSSGNFKIFYIFSPSKRDMADVLKVIDRQEFDYPVFIDTIGVFERWNLNIIKNPKFKVFLTDKNNEVKLLGNPIGNEKLRELYMNVINESEQ